MRLLDSVEILSWLVVVSLGTLRSSRFATALRVRYNSRPERGPFQGLDLESEPPLLTAALIENGEKMAVSPPLGRRTGAVLPRPPSPTPSPQLPGDRLPGVPPAPSRLRPTRPTLRRRSEVSPIPEDEEPNGTPPPPLPPKRSSSRSGRLPSGPDPPPLPTKTRDYRAPGLLYGAKPSEYSGPGPAGASDTALPPPLPPKKHTPPALTRTASQGPSGEETQLRLPSLTPSPERGGGADPPLPKFPLVELIVDNSARAALEEAARESVSIEADGKEIKSLGKGFPLGEGQQFTVEAPVLGPQFPATKLTRGRMLGAGANGIVFEARQVATGLQVAVKMPRSTDQGLLADIRHQNHLDDDTRKRIARRMEDKSRRAVDEYNIGNRYFPGLRAHDVLHEHHLVIPLHAAGRVEGLPSMVLAGDSVIYNNVGVYPAGIEGLDMVAVNFEMPFAVKAEVARQMLRALAALEARQLLHGDVKTANYIVFDKGVVALGDLANLEHKHNSNGTPKTLDCRDRLRYGSPAYLSPEHASCVVLKTKVPRTPQMDWWALGVSLYELFCDMALPYSLDTIFDQSVTNFLTTLHGYREAPPPLSFKGCDATPEWQDIIAGLLQFDPQSRTSPSTVLASAPGVVQPKAGTFSSAS